MIIDSTRWSRVVAVFALFFLSGGPAGAQTAGTAQAGQAVGEPVAVEIELVTTERTGGNGARAWGHFNLRPGESDTTRVWVGGRADNATCLGWVGAGRLPTSAGLARPTSDTESPSVMVRHAWEVTVQLVSVDIDQVRLRVDWKRYNLDPEAGLTQVAGDVRTPSIAEETPHILDFLAVEGDGCQLAHVRVEVEAKVEDAEAFAGRGIDYDLWLVHDSADGQRETRHRLANGQHGHRTEFWFPTLEWSLENPACTLGLTIRGQLRGRLQPNGTVDLTVSPTAVLRLSDNREVDTASNGVGSRSILGLTPGEAVEVQIPLPLATSALTGLCDAVALLEFFDGHSTALRISASAAQSP